MSDKPRRTNPLLVLLCLLLCLVPALLVSQPSGLSSQVKEEDLPVLLEMPAKEERQLASETGGTDSSKSDIEESGSTETDSQEQASATETPAPEKVYSNKGEAYDHPVSEFASRGTWFKEKGKWYFRVDDQNISGWLYDTDGKTYYFSPVDQIMATGWQEIDGKYYYFDLDGIMNHDRLSQSAQMYYFHKDGTLNLEETSDEAMKALDEKLHPAEEEDEDSPEETASADTGETKKAKAAAGSSGLVALTFDDGPSEFTDRLLDSLEKNNAKATFFVVGTEASSFPEPLARMEQLGCEIGNHSYSHADLIKLDADGIRSQIEGTNALIREQTGHDATLVRPPYGDVNDLVRQTIPVPLILWSVDTLDWETLDADSTVQIALDEVQDGSIILMHDIYGATVDAAERLIPELIDRGYELVTVSELAKRRGITLSPGIAYGSF